MSERLHLHPRLHGVLRGLHGGVSERRRSRCSSRPLRQPHINSLQLPILLHGLERIKRLPPPGRVQRALQPHARLVPAVFRDVSLIRFPADEKIKRIFV